MNNGSFQMVFWEVFIMASSNSHAFSLSMPCGFDWSWDWVVVSRVRETISYTISIFDVIFKSKKLICAC